jgi:acetoacetate decarboxylase
MCSATGLTVPWSANYGAFDESALSVKCRYKGQEGWFAVVAFLNSKSSIPAGREIYGTPKVYADFRVDYDERVMYTDTLVAGTTLMSIRTTMQREARFEDLPNSGASWRLKVIPRVDGKGVDVMQLIEGANVSSDVTVHVCRAGDGVVQFNPSPIYDLSDFVPLEYFRAYYLEMDYTERYGEIIHDFLEDE